VGTVINMQDKGMHEHVQQHAHQSAAATSAKSSLLQHTQLIITSAKCILQTNKLQHQTLSYFTNGLRST